MVMMMERKYMRVAQMRVLSNMARHCFAGPERMLAIRKEIARLNAHHAEKVDESGLSGSEHM